jgi:hypothetical protein
MIEVQITPIEEPQLPDKPKAVDCDSFEGREFVLSSDEIITAIWIYLHLKFVTSFEKFSPQNFSIAIPERCTLVLDYVPRGSLISESKHTF